MCKKNKNHTNLPFAERFERGYEVQDWIDEHINDIEQYVIFDDDIDFLESQQNNFVCCSDNFDHEDCVDYGYGLTRKNAEKAIKILNNERNF